MLRARKAPDAEEHARCSKRPGMKRNNVLAPLTRRVGWAALAAALPGLLLIGLPTAEAASPPSTARQSALLEPLGRAYARDCGLVLQKLQLSVAGKVTAADRAKWEARLAKALAIGYRPTASAFQALPLEQLKDVVKPQMGRQRTPARVVKGLAAPGNLVLHATWTFAGVPPVKTLAVFSPQGEILFDTLLAMPVIEGPVFSRRH